MGELPVIGADVSQMRQLFQNLIANALKFQKNDVLPVIKIDGIIKGGRCEISVMDNDIGFDEKYLDRIFPLLV